MSHKIISRNDKNGKSYSYIYVTDYTKYQNEDQLDFNGSVVKVNLTRAITPRYFKMVFFSTPNSQYTISNWRKAVRNDPLNPNIITNAPLKMVWRESNDGGATWLPPYEVDVPVGNYDIINLKPVLENLMNTASPNITYTVDFNEIDGRTYITGVNRVIPPNEWTFALWYGDYNANKIQYDNYNQLMSVVIGYGIIPLEDTFTLQKKSTYVYDLSPNTLYLVEIVGYDNIEVTGENSPITASFTGTWVVNAGKSNTFYIDQFKENDDFSAITYISDRKTFSYLDIRIKDYLYGEEVLLNGSDFLMILEFQEFD